MDTDIVWNNAVKQKDPSQAVVIAISHHDIFEGVGERRLHSETDSQEPGPLHTANENELLRPSTAFPVIKAVQKVNEKLVEKNPDETLLFDVILVSNNHCPDSRSRIIDSVKHYGLQISRFCFCSNDFTESLLSNNVKLYLSTKREDAAKALEKGVPAALLCRQGGEETTDQLRILFAGDIDGFSEDQGQQLKDEGPIAVECQKMLASKSSLKELVMLIGKIRSRFGRDSSPLCTCLMTLRSSKEVCVRALKNLQDWGLEIDQAFCLAGAPKSSILTQVQPHVLYYGPNVVQDEGQQ